MQLMTSRVSVITVILMVAPVSAEEVTLEEIVKLRKEAAHRQRRIVIHSDGMSMDPNKRFLEPGDCVLPFVPGTQTDACTYSLIHQFPVVRLYRSQVGHEWPPGNIEKMYGDGPDGLELYIEFCRQNGYEAFWAMRTNDTHDAANTEHGLRRWNSNQWKLAHPELLVSSRDRRPRYAQWSAFDYAQPKVREKAFQILDEVCRNYDIDGVVLDFFRHLPTFKSTAWGGEASDEERAMMTGLFRQVRQMMDEVGAQRGRPILLAVRTPDAPAYSRALGLDVEQWMKEELIDIWIATGYFRLQEWEETVKIGHKYGVPVWASIDESRVERRENRGSLEAYRSRIMNAWHAGVDAIWMFNFFHYPQDRQFQLLFEAGDPQTLAYTDKMYVADARGLTYGRYYLKDGERFFTRPETFSPLQPVHLKSDEPRVVDLRISDDPNSAPTAGYTAEITLRIQASPGSGRDDLRVKLNDVLLSETVSIQDPAYGPDWVAFAVEPALVTPGMHRVEIARGRGSRQEPILIDLQLWIKYRSNK